MKVQYQVFFARGAAALDKAAAVPWEDRATHHLLHAFFVAAQSDAGDPLRMVSRDGERHRGAKPDPIGVHARDPQPIEQG